MFLIPFFFFPFPPLQSNTRQQRRGEAGSLGHPLHGSAALGGQAEPLPPRKERDPAVSYTIALSTARRRRLNPATKAASGAPPGCRSVLSGDAAAAETAGADALRAERGCGETRGEPRWVRAPLPERRRGEKAPPPLRLPLTSRRVSSSPASW